ncbi:MAG: hypothetical protein S4CHLAM20_01320 [Chlamydiia bacterium]|nr:hypothetical protein [Chlamydiia bacterium]
MKLIFIILLLTQTFLCSRIINIPRNLREDYHPDFLKKRETRKDSSPIISTESFRAHADFILDETITEIETNDLFDGAVVFVGLRSLRDFYYEVLPHIKNNIIVVSHGGEPFKHSQLNWAEYYLSDEYLTPKMANHPNILAFYTTNMIYKHPKCFCLPIGACHWFPRQARIINKFKKSCSRNSYFSNKDIHVYLNGSNGTHRSRRLIFDYWKLVSEVTYIERVSFRSYFRNLKRSRFVISPRGYEIDCFRTWESLYAGAIPVVESWGIDSVYEGLPVIIVKDLTKVTIKDLEEDYEKLKQKEFNLDALSIDYWMERIRNAK